MTVKILHLKYKNMKEKNIYRLMFAIPVSIVIIITILLIRYYPGCNSCNCNIHYNSGINPTDSVHVGDSINHSRPRKSGMSITNPVHPIHVKFIKF